MNHDDTFDDAAADDDNDRDHPGQIVRWLPLIRKVIIISS